MIRAYANLIRKVSVRFLKLFSCEISYSMTGFPENIQRRRKNLKKISHLSGK